MQHTGANIWQGTKGPSMIVELHVGK